MLYETVNIIVSESDRMSKAAIETFIKLYKALKATEAELECRQWVDDGSEEADRQMWRLEVRIERLQRAINKLTASHGAALAPLTGDARTLPFVMEVI